MKKTTTNLSIKYGCAYSHSSGVPQLLATVLASFMLEDMSHCSCLVVTPTHVPQWEGVVSGTIITEVVQIYRKQIGDGMLYFLGKMFNSPETTWSEVHIFASAV